VSGLVLSHFTDGKQKVTSRQGEAGNPSLVSTPAWDESRRAHPRRHAVPGRPTSASATPRQSPRPASVLDLVPAPRTSVPPLPAADARTLHVHRIRGQAHPSRGPRRWRGWDERHRVRLV